MLILVNPFPVTVYTSIVNFKEETSEVFRDMFGNFAPGDRPEADKKPGTRDPKSRIEAAETRKRTVTRATTHDCEFLSFRFYSAYDFASVAIFLFARFAELNYGIPSFTGCKMTFLIVGKCCNYYVIGSQLFSVRTARSIMVFHKNIETHVFVIQISYSIINALNKLPVFYILKRNKNISISLFVYLGNLSVRDFNYYSIHFCLN